MNQRGIVLHWLGLSAIILCATTACTIKATLDTTTDGTTEFVSSTSGHGWWTEDGLVKEGKQAQAFVAFNSTNLLEDIAQGHGIYLSAFRTTLGIAEEDGLAFDKLVQSDYSTLANFTAEPGYEQAFVQYVEQLWNTSALKTHKAS